MQRQISSRCEIIIDQLELLKHTLANAIRYKKEAEELPPGSRLKTAKVNEFESELNLIQSFIKAITSLQPSKSTQIFLAKIAVEIANKDVEKAHAIQQEYEQVEKAHFADLFGQFKAAIAIYLKEQTDSALHNIGKQIRVLTENGLDTFILKNKLFEALNFEIFYRPGKNYKAISNLFTEITHNLGPVRTAELVQQVIRHPEHQKNPIPILHRLISLRSPEILESYLKTLVMLACEKHLNMSDYTSVINAKDSVGNLLLDILKLKSNHSLHSVWQPYHEKIISTLKPATMLPAAYYYSNLVFFSPIPLAFPNENLPPSTFTMSKFQS